MPDDRKIFFAKLREVIDLKSEQKVKKLKSKDDSKLKTRKKVNILDLDDDEKIKTKSKDDFDLKPKKVNILNLDDNEMAKLRNEGQKVTIYDAEDMKKSVEIIWPSNPTFGKIVSLINKKLKKQSK